MQETNALPGMDIIQLPSGIYILSISGVGENSAETGDLDITGSLTIFGAGTSNTVIDAGNQDRVLHIVYYEEPNSVFISDLTIRGGLLDSELLAGSGLHNESGFVTLTNVSVRGNQTVNYGQGAGIYNSGTLTLTSSAVLSNATSSNSGAGYGGGIYNNHSLTLKNSLVAYNTNGGGIHNHAGTVEISDSIISWNQRASPADGGGIANSFGAVMTLTNSIISHNTACNGAGMLNG
ncbi:MAG TPA: hypothetical protein PLK31_25715, partial [Chloroflexota bacterium]|nr:hypothetical protein [Chloroflexota bacterium]